MQIADKILIETETRRAKKVIIKVETIMVKIPPSRPEFLKLSNIKSKLKFCRPAKIILPATAKKIAKKVKNESQERLKNNLFFKIAPHRFYLIIKEQKQRQLTRAHKKTMMFCVGPWHKTSLRLCL